MLTHQQGQLALTHVLENLFQFTSNDPLYLGLTTAGYTDIHQILTMDPTEIDVLTYTDASQTEVSVPVPARAYLHILKAYHAYRYDEGNPISDDWISITAKELDTFRVEEYNVITMMPTLGYMPHHHGSTPPSTVPHPQDPVANFKKGIKHDPTLFLSFKIEKQWVSRQHSTLAQARAQDVADVLNPTYAPSLIEDKLLFEEKQKYLYAVFEQQLQTDKGKALVHEHDATLDAQAIYAALLDHYTKSVKASLDQSQLMIYITTIKIGDGSWRGLAASFVLNWQDKVCEFENCPMSRIIFQMNGSLLCYRMLCIHWPNFIKSS